MQSITGAPFIAGKLNSTCGTTFKSSELACTGSGILSYYSVNCLKTVTGIQDLLLQDDLTYLGWQSALPQSPYELYGRIWTFYKTRTDNWSFTDLEYGAASYAGHCSLAGAGDCPVMSGYGIPNFDTTNGITLNYVDAQNMYWAEENAPNMWFGGGGGGIPYSFYVKDWSDSLISLGAHYEIPYVYPLPTVQDELLTMQCGGGTQDCTAKYQSAIGAFLPLSFDSTNLFTAEFNDWAQFSGRDGEIPYTLNPDDYDDSLLIVHGGTPKTPMNDWRQAMSGWDIATQYGDNIMLMSMVRSKVEMTGSKPIKYGLGKYTKSPAFVQGGFIYQHSYAQWQSTTELIGYSIAYPDKDGHVTIEVPYPIDDKPFPIAKVGNMPVTAEYIFLFVDGVVNPPAWVSTYVSS